MLYILYIERIVYFYFINIFERVNIMYDELASIERNYGSVAEYNRVREEERQEREWNALPESAKQSIEEQARARRDRFKKEVEALSIEPSDLVKSIKAEYDAESEELLRKKKSGELSYNEYVNAGYKHSDELIATAIPKIEELYGIKFEKGSQFGKSDPGKFSVSFEKSEFSQIFNYTASNLDKEQFMHIYTDMRELVGYKAFPCYRDDKEHKPDIWGHVNDKHYVSGLSLGELRKSYFDGWGVPNDDAHQIIENLDKPSKSDVAKAKLASAMKAYGDDDVEMSDPSIV